MLTSTLMKRFLGVLAPLALALGLFSLATPPASAASTVWDRVARCESGNRWNINTGNGYYGGLQFSARTWSGFGGGQYASRANKASKAEQIAVARRVLAVQGPGAWPHCSRVAGLTKSNGKANRNATPSSNPGAKASAKKSPAKKATPKKASATTSKAKTTRVRSGDTLGKIASRHSVAGGWQGLWKLNKKTLKNPHQIKIGQVLRIR